MPVVMREVVGWMGWGEHRVLATLNLSEGHGSKETEEDVMIPRGSQG